MNKIINSDYRSFIKEIKLRIRKAQIKASVSVNKELIKLYWDIAESIVKKQKQTKWGDGFIRLISVDLSNEFTQIKGFSQRNIKYIRQWFLFYNQHSLIGQQLVAQLAQIPWGHNILIISKCKNVNEAIFYVQKTIQNNWSRSVLNHHVKAITNFKATLPKPQSDLAMQTIKDPYNFDFLTIREKHNEKELEISLIEHVSNFLLERGIIIRQTNANKNCNRKSLY